MHVPVVYERWCCHTDQHHPYHCGHSGYHELHLVRHSRHSFIVLFDGWFLSLDCLFFMRFVRVVSKFNIPKNASPSQSQFGLVLFMEVTTEPDSLKKGSNVQNPVIER
jgi:hypothetical protein